VVAATSPITFAAGTVAFDQSANNTTNDTRYARLGAANAFTVGNHTITPQSDATKGLIMRGFSATQSANLFEVQTSASVVQSGFEAFGRLFVRSGVVFGTASLSVSTNNVAGIPVAVRGLASQSGDLQQWQNSAGTVLAKVEAGGTIRSETGGLALTGNFAALFTANSGGLLLMKKSSALNSAPGTDYARLYFRDGTTAGTLKLVVRAGTAGAETTILDNIPQT
jgi:hypothetical protein